MNTQKQASHVQNISNFYLLTTICEGHNTKYSPSKGSLQINALQTKYQAVSDANDQANQHLAEYRIAVDSQKESFNQLKTIIMRVENAVEASDAGEAAVADLKIVTRKIKGIRAVAKKKAGSEQATDPTQDPAPQNISVAQTGHADKIEHLAKAIKLLEILPDYQPNEPELAIAAIKDFHNKLDTKFKKKQNVLVALQNARSVRDKELYDNETGLVATAQQVKKYIKSVFGSNSPEYKQVSKIKFRKMNS